MQGVTLGQTSLSSAHDPTTHHQTEPCRIAVSIGLTRDGFRNGFVVGNESRCQRRWHNTDVNSKRNKENEEFDAVRGSAKRAMLGMQIE